MRLKKVSRALLWCGFASGMISVLVSLSACGGRVYAPVSDVSTIEKIPAKGVHIVRRGETLYSIAWRYGMDYRTLAAMNHISPPWRVWLGESIYLRNQTGTYSINTHSISHAQKKHKNGLKVTEYGFVEPKEGHWRWPAKGRLAGVYSSFNRGINIAGHQGEAIYATAAGRVVYAGDGLRGYGNLIIIKHNNAWLSAYAWNKNMLVREGETVRAGQAIATMGSMGQFRPMLHFEIRYNGKPVNPLRYLSKGA